jgi:C_GCAxxG_C_C family probable redox protein
MKRTTEKEKILLEAERRAYRYEQEYRDCAQCTLLTIQELLGLESEEALKAATGFAGGIGRSSSVCGAFTGGVMALGLKYGRDLPTMKHPDAEKRLALFREIEERLDRLIRRLSDKFVETYGSTICKDIETKLFGRSFDKWNPEERKEKDRLGGHDDKCPSVVGNGTRWVAELILEEEEKEEKERNGLGHGAETGWLEE